MALLQSEQHITGGSEQGGIALAEQHHCMPLFHLRSDGRRRPVPGIPPGAGGLHHREQQRQLALIRPNPRRSNRRGHALDPLTRHRHGHHLGPFDRTDRSQSEQIRITGANTDNGEAGGHGRVDDGQRKVLRRPGDESSQHLSRQA